jgi:hypothetical protein
MTDVVIDLKELSRFAEIMIENYKKNSIFKEISQIIPYSKDIQGNFFQIGERTLIPKEFFKVGNNVENGFLAEDFARSVVFGEINFMINYLTKLASDNKLPFYKIKEFSYPEIANIIMTKDNMPAPTDIFIPIDLPYYNEVHNWLYKKQSEYKDNNLYILIENYKVKVHWSSRFTPLNSIILLDKRGIRVIQKKFEDIKIPSELGKLLYSYKEGEPLRIDFAQSKEEDKFDLYFRSVVAFESMRKDAVAVIELPKIESKKD